jgi:RNA polymerase sigma-70 factor, ECF subfamily
VQGTSASLLDPSARPPVARREAALIRRARGGAPDAVEALVRRHWADAHRTAFLIVHDAAAAEDVTQEAMLAAVQALAGFDRRRPFRPWLHKMVVNRSLDWLRARSRRPEVVVDEPPAHAATRPDALSAELMLALAALDAEDRAIVVLRHLLGYRSREIGSMLGLPGTTVRTRLARALDRLRTVIEEGDS